MTRRSVAHATFVVERVYEASPARVFDAWADPSAKARWFGGSDEWNTLAFELDFRIGGRETNTARPVAGGPVHSFNGQYHDIIPDQRIVYSYDMHLDDTRISVSLATVEFRAEGSGTRLVFTEQGAFLDGYDDAGKWEQGTRELLDALGSELRHQAATA